MRICTQPLKARIRRPRPGDRDMCLGFLDGTINNYRHAARFDHSLDDEAFGGAKVSPKDGVVSENWLGGC